MTNSLVIIIIVPCVWASIVAIYFLQLVGPVNYDVITISM